ncbi:hypothetical protein Unana1_03072 [Umbelopsis nana]
MSSARASSSSANKPPNKTGKDTSSKLVRKHPQPAASNEYRDIGSTTVPDGNAKGKNTKKAPSGKISAQCPSYTDKKGDLIPDSPFICPGINHVKQDVRSIFSHPLYKQHIGQHIDPYLDQVQAHYNLYAVPALETTKHYGSKYGVPAAQQAHALYKQHVHPIYLKAHDHAKQQYDIHAKSHVNRYYSEAEQRYRQHLAPHVDYATTTANKLHQDALKFHKEKVVPFNNRASKHIQDTYDIAKPILLKAIDQSVEFYHKKFEPAALAALDTMWHLIKEISYKVRIVSTDVANKAYIWSKDAYENHARPYYQKTVAPVIAQNYKQYLEPSVNDAKKFIIAHVDMELVEQSWSTAKVHTNKAYKFAREHTLMVAGVVAEFLNEQYAKYEESRVKAAEAAKSVQHEAIVSASSATAKVSKIVAEQEPSVKAAKAHATNVASDIKDKAEGAVHHFASEAVNMAKNAQTKVYDAAGTVLAQASKGSDAAYSHYEKAKQAVAGGIHHGADQASSIVSQASAKFNSIGNSASSIVSQASVTQKTNEPSITPLAVVTTSTSAMSQTSADTVTYPTVTNAATPDEDSKARVTDGKITNLPDTNDSAQTIPARFRDATKASEENISTERVTKASGGDHTQKVLEVIEVAEEIVSEELEQIVGDQGREQPASESAILTNENQEAAADANTSEVEQEDDVTPIQPRVPAPVKSSVETEAEQQTEDVVDKANEDQVTAAPIPELRPKGQDDLSELPPNDVAEHIDESEYKQAPIRSEQKGYLNDIVSSQIEEIIKSADIIRSQLEMKYDDIEKEALESLQHASSSVEADSEELVSSLVHSFKDFYQQQSADSRTSNKDKVKAIESKYRDTLKFLATVLSDQRSVSSESTRHANSAITSAQKSAEAQVRQRFKEGLHRLRSGEQDVTGLTERQHRELKAKLEDAQVEAIKLIHSAEKAIAIEQRLLDTRTHRISSKIDRLETTAKEQLGTLLEQAKKVLSLKEPLVDLDATVVEADLEGFEIEHQPVPEETSPVSPSDGVNPVQPVAEQIKQELQHQQIIDEHIRKAQERAARVAKTVEDWVEAAKRKSARSEIPTL